MHEFLTPIPARAQVTVRFTEQEKYGCMSVKRPHLETIDENDDLMIDDETYNMNNQSYMDDELLLAKGSSLDLVRLTNKKKQYL